MRAWQVQGQGEPIDVLREAEVDVPEPGPGHLRVRVDAAGIGLPDVLMCRGSYPLTPPLPFTPGQEVVGEVTAVGDDVDVAVGTRVMGVSAFFEGHGSFAEECLALPTTVFPIPVGLDDAAAAGFWIPHVTASTALVERGRVQPGEWLIVLGAAGGSGIAAVQLGKALGAKVVAVVSDDERAAFCRGLGADATVDHRAGPVADALREATDSHGADLIFDPVGGALANDAIRALARNGRLLAIGFASGEWPSFEVHDLVIANATVMGVFAGGQSPEQLDEIHAELSRLVAEGTLRNAVTSTPSWAELPQTVQRLADRAFIGKAVMVP
jgi:NADPH2:quinone reductase